MIAAARHLLRHRPGFRRLWLGNLISQLGDWIGWVAVAVVALHEGGPLDVALVFAAHHLPAAALTPVSGVLADRYDRRRVLVVTSLGLGGITVAMVGAAAAGSLLLLQWLLAIRSALTAFFAPAERAVLPRVVARDELMMAGAIDAGSWSVVFSLGMAAGGLLAALGPTLALTLDAATFLLAAAVWRRLPPVAPPSAEPGSPRRSVRGELVDAWRVMVEAPDLRRAVLAKAPFAVAGGAAWLALALRAEALLGAAIGFGLLHAIRGVGTGVGPALAVRVLQTGARRELVWQSTYALGLVGVVALGFASGVGVAVVAVFAWGIGGGANWVICAERIAALGPDRYMARLGAIDQVAMIVAMTVAVLVLAGWVELGGSLGAGVLGLSGLAAVGWLELVRHSRALRSDVHPTAA